MRLKLKPLVLLTFTTASVSVAAVVPLIDVAAGVPGILKLIVLPVAVIGVAAVVFMIQLPVKAWVNAPVVKVAVPPRVKLPLTVSTPVAVFAALPESPRWW